jgi:hypothetical protein
MLGLIFLRLTYDQPGIQNINGVLFLLIANSSFSYVVIVINVSFFFNAEEFTHTRVFNEFRLLDFHN